jgi:hypothetical protein
VVAGALLELSVSQLLLWLANAFLNTSHVQLACAPQAHTGVFKLTKLVMLFSESETMQMARYQFGSKFTHTL